jgi:MSHA biogenesis protein MshI
VGIGLSDEGVALAHLSRKNNDYLLANVGYATVNSVNELDSRLSQWIRDFNLKNSETNFVLAQSQSNILLTEAPEVEDKELKQAMQWKLKDNSDIDLEKSIIDVFAIPGQRERGRQPMAYVVSAEKKLLKDYVSLIDKHELDLKSIDITAMAQRNIASQLPEDENGIAFLSLYSKSGLFSISRQKNLFLTRDLDVGYENFSKDPVIESDNGIQVEGLPPATQQTLEQIVLEVQRSMDYYERYFAQPPVSTLVLAPLPVAMPGLLDEISGQLGIKVRELDMQDVVNMEQTELDRVSQGHCLSAIGAALRLAQKS